MADPFALSPPLQALASEAERCAAQGQGDAAERLFRQVLDSAPEYSRALSFLAMRAFAAGRLEEAAGLIQRACAGSPRLALIEANRSLILQELGDVEGALSALDAALKLDPGFVPAYFSAAELLEAQGRTHDAMDHYQNALRRIPGGAALPPVMQAKVAHAERFIARKKVELESLVERHLAPLRTLREGEQGERFEECLAILFGHKRPQQPRPGTMFFPKLTPYTFFPRRYFDWIERAEAATAAVREELQAVMAGSESGFIPYVQKSDVDAGPGSVWSPLNHNTDWGAYFLLNHGKRVERHAASCPRTMALLDSLPLVRIPGRAPTAFFSRLRPGTRIPPHHGVTNTRLIVHLPLIVPEGCGIRVGNDVRHWREGEVLVFDDTVEHEAWNDSQQTRVVLIFDIWNPLIEPHERELLAAMTQALAEFSPRELHKTDF